MNSKIKTKSVLAVGVYLRVISVDLNSTIFLDFARDVRGGYIICSIVTSIIYRTPRSVLKNVKSS